MKALIRAEVLKLRSTRASWVLALGALGLVIVAVTAMSVASQYTPGDHPARQALALAGTAQTFALLLGVLVVTSEFRYGTITPALLISPRRTPLLVAKVITLTAAGLALGLLAFGGAAAIALPVLSARHITTQVDAASMAAIIAGGAITAGLAAALGVGFGALIRNQVGAIVAALGVLYVIEPLLSVIPGVEHTVQRYGLGGLTSGASGTTAFPTNAHILGQIPAALVLGSYALAVVFAGAMLFQRRDLAM
jgi:ABC-2 type transport system permease protein